jgi:hypothetical protein
MSAIGYRNMLARQVCSLQQRMRDAADPRERYWLLLELTDARVALRDADLEARCEAQLDACYDDDDDEG